MCGSTGGLSHACQWNYTHGWLGNKTFYVSSTNAGRENSPVGVDSFNISRDTTAPTVTGANNHNVTNGSTDQYTLTLLDDFLFSYNVSCTDQNVTASGLATTSFLLNMSHSITGTVSCSYTVCDGHTARLLPPAFGYTQNNSRSVKIRPTPYDEFDFFTNEASLSIVPTQEQDRISFAVTDSVRTPGTRAYVFYWQATDSSRYFPNSLWMAHIIDDSTKTWFDMQGAQDVDVFYRGNGLWELTVTTSARTFTLRSVGALNCVSGSYTIGVAPEGESAFGNFGSDYCPTTTPEMIFLFLLFCIIVAIWIVAFKFHSTVMGLIAMFFTFGFGFILSGCAAFLGIMLAIIAIMLFVVSVL